MTMSGNVYICAYGDTFDSVAKEVYGDEIYAADILCANPSLCNKYTLEAGDELQLPIIYIPENDEDDDDAEYNQAVPSAPWR